MKDHLIRELQIYETQLHGKMHSEILLKFFLINKTIREHRHIKITNDYSSALTFSANIFFIDESLLQILKYLYFYM